ncbi:NifU family protein [Aphanothece sacrum]|uniref:Nitrogen fixation protein NifU n=1 Tax=Aphanothece sacrum FPU1 TaxID=1920663 RepID=A0A401ICC5_APHSA|nr:NifU family protein [Aphanothece sacrum]GBF78917.1 nitrogen fixation protein NifU [Aphanothece sacrum FPU1]GBF86736.1 nitrogen fixation protein NifU [Aphanothece sacrum FPU3]
MTQNIPSSDTIKTLEELVQQINKYEEIISQWDKNQQVVVEGLKQAVEALHKEALTRLIRSVKQESLSALRHAVEDEIVYGLLCYHELIKPPKPPLEQRIHQALESIRPGLKSHNGDVELVNIKLPDTVEVQLLGTCSNCPASTLTMKQGVEEAIKTYCPEITKVISINTKNNNKNQGNIESPFAASEDAGWIALANVDEIPNGGILPLEIEGLKLILVRNNEIIKGYRNSCMHLAMPLDTGDVEKGILTCLHHGFKYHLETGECLTAPEIFLESYPVKRVRERVLVKLE